LNLDCHSTHSR